MLKSYNSFTSSVRHRVSVDRRGLWKGKPEKSLVCYIGASKAGRNSAGRITVWNRGGGVKRKYRMIDFKRKKFDVQAEVLRIEYDPNRNAFIALLRYEDGVLSYIIAPSELKIGDKVISGSDVDIRIGNSMPLHKIPVGTLIHNIELKPGAGAQLVRAAGGYAQLISKEHTYVLLKLSSGEVRKVLANCFATIGVVSNQDVKNVKLGKAGKSRLLGRRPTVRGVAMNPIDHPHGGGEGKTSGGRHPSTPWGKSTKGYRTRRSKRNLKLIVLSRHKAAKR